MKRLLLLSLTAFQVALQPFAQKEFELVPDSCEFVVTIDLSRIGRSFSMNDASNYQFVSFIFENYLNSDGTSVNLNELGMDLMSNPTYFAGKVSDYDYSGVIIKLNKPNTFVNKVISDNIIRKELLENKFYIENRELFLLHNNFYIAVTINANESLAFSVTDSIFDANEWKKPFRWSSFFGEFNWDDMDFSPGPPPDETVVEEIIIEEEEAVDTAFDASENTDNGLSWNSLLNEDDEHDYYGVKDSVSNALSEKFAHLFRKNVLNNKSGLAVNNAAFKNALGKRADVIAYIQSSGMYNQGTFPYSPRNPFLQGFDAYLQNTWQTGYINFTPQGMDIEWVNHVGEEMMRVMKAMSKSKFDKKLLNYIPAHSSAFMTMNVNTSAAYNEFKTIYLPQLENSGNPEKMLMAAVWALIDEIVDEESLFDLYLSKAFVTFNGIRDMVVERITFDYDEETFEYTELVEAGIDKVPALTFGMATKRTAVFEKFLDAMAARESDVFTKEGAYYKMKRGPIPGITFYIMLKDNIMIMTNEQDIVRNYPSGYGKNAITGKLAKEAGSSQLLYANLNMQNIPDKISELIVNSADRKFVQAMTEKPGALEIKMGEMTKTHYSFKGAYTFNGNYKNGAYYLMEVLNLMMSYEDPYFDDY